MSRLLAPLADLTQIVGVAAFIGVALLALVRGPLPQRLAGALLLVDGFGLMLVDILFEDVPRALGSDIKALLVLGAYALMTLRWPDRWIMALTALQGLAVLLRLSRWQDGTLTIEVTGLVLNLTGWLMLIVLASACLLQPTSPPKTSRTA